jgi:peptidoglycan/xylan/chitin deacetylase (PgdA/CDA1 family)
MTPHVVTSRAARLGAAVALALVVAGCGLGDIPTRPPRPTPVPTPTPTPSPTPVPTPTVPPTPTAVPSPTPLVYTVKAGDSLLKIAKRYKTTGRSIAYWNRAKYPSLDPDSPKYDPNRIEIGWKLTIYPGVTVDDTNPPPAAASPTPEPTLSLGPAETPPPDGSGLLVSHGRRQSNAVALTFDLGGPTGPALPIVRWLVDRRVPASFFVPGQLVETDPTVRSVVSLVAAHPDLFTVGDGAWSEVDLTGLTSAGVADQLTRAETAISAAMGTTARPLFRPPDGAQNAMVRAAAATAGFPYTVMWDIDAGDLTPESAGGPTADDIVTRIAARSQGGSIVRLHLGGENTLEALPGILDALGASGLQPVTLATLLRL